MYLEVSKRYLAQLGPSLKAGRFLLGPSVSIAPNNGAHSGQKRRSNCSAMLGSDNNTPWGWTAAEQTLAVRY